MLELMHFPDELLSAKDFKAPASRSVGAQEMKMATQIIESMSSKWTPEMYKDDYREALEKVIEEKVEQGGSLPNATRRRKKATNVIDLVAVLQQSLEKTNSRRGNSKAGKAKRAA